MHTGIVHTRSKSLMSNVFSLERPRFIRTHSGGTLAASPILQNLQTIIIKRNEAHPTKPCRMGEGYLAAGGTHTGSGHI